MSKDTLYWQDPSKLTLIITSASALPPVQELGEHIDQQGYTVLALQAYLILDPQGQQNCHLCRSWGST